MLDIRTGHEYNKILNSEGMVVMKFGSRNCAPCRVMQPGYLKLAERMSNVVFCSIDIDTAKDIEDVKEIPSLPTFLVYQDGKPYSMIVGTDLAKLEAELV